MRRGQAENRQITLRADAALRRSRPRTLGSARPGPGLPAAQAPPGPTGAAARLIRVQESRAEGLRRGPEGGGGGLRPAAGCTDGLEPSARFRCGARKGLRARARGGGLTRGLYRAPRPEEMMPNIAGAWRFRGTPVPSQEPRSLRVVAPRLGRCPAGAAVTLTGRARRARGLGPAGTGRSASPARIRARRPGESGGARSRRVAGGAAGAGTVTGGFPGGRGLWGSVPLRPRRLSRGKRPDDDGFRVCLSGFRVYLSGFRVYLSGFRVYLSGFRVYLKRLFEPRKRPDDGGFFRQASRNSEIDSESAHIGLCGRPVRHGPGGRPGGLDRASRGPAVSMGRAARARRSADVTVGRAGPGLGILPPPQRSR